MVDIYVNIGTLIFKFSSGIGCKALVAFSSTCLLIGGFFHATSFGCIVGVCFVLSCCNSMQNKWFCFEVCCFCFSNWRFCFNEIRYYFNEIRLCSSIMRFPLNKTLYRWSIIRFCLSNMSFPLSEIRFCLSILRFSLSVISFCFYKCACCKSQTMLLLWV